MSADLHRWLLADAPSLVHEAFLPAFAQRLIAAGVPVDRLWSGRLFLNPLVAGDSWCWTYDGRLRQVLLPFANRQRATPPEGPMRRVFAERLVHQPLTGLPRGAYDMADELWDEGYTDLLALGIHWGSTDAHARVAMTFATRAPGGFDPTAVATLDGAIDALRLVVRATEQERLTRGLLGTYLGRHAAGRVLHGQVRRGDGETLRAAIWFSDLRGFTSLSDTLPREQLLALLDDAFEAQAAAIHANGGEVLKFIGDGLLAVFRGEPDVACRSALAASASFGERLALVNARRERSGEVAIRFGLALHYGDVMYGNIGAPDRLDFTVIGPAVNLAARLEGLTARLDRSVVLSESFAAACGSPTAPLGEHAVKGLVDAVRVFASA